MKKSLYNILFILAEDICPNLGCYYDVNAKTPFLDAFAKEAIRFNNAYSCGPVCSAARSSLILGVNGSTAGVGNHRSLVKRPEKMKIFPYYLKQAGYYTAIGKTDFNFSLSPEEEFDEYITESLSEDTELLAQRIAETYHKCKEDQPFFIMHTIMCTHQSQYGYTDNASCHRTSMPRLKQEEYCDRDTLKIPEYHYDNKGSREIWGQYYEKMTTMDRMFGEVIAQLKRDKIYDSTLVCFMGDNGHGIPGGKCALWDEGVHVPMMLRIPNNWKHTFKMPIRNDDFGKVTDQKVSFLDLAPSALEIANLKIPHYMQGKSLFTKINSNRGILAFADRVGENFEGLRSFYYDDYLYIKDFSYSPFYSLNSYSVAYSSWFLLESARDRDKTLDASRKNWFMETARFDEQLYNLKEDPAGLINLAKDEEHSEILIKIRKKCFKLLIDYKDDMLFPEPLIFSIHNQKCAKKIFANENTYPLKKLLQLEENTSNGEKIDYLSLMSSEEPVVRFYVLRKTGKFFSEQHLLQCLEDEEETIRIMSAWYLMERENVNHSKALETILKIIKQTQNIALMIFIVDLLKWKINNAAEIYHAMLERINQQNIPGDAKYQHSLLDSLCYIQKRIGSDEKLNYYTHSWTDEVDLEINQFVKELCK